MTENAFANNIQFLSGGGEMGKLTRTKDWSKTVIGPIDTWPQSLRTTINILINSKFPMFLWWGKELICFYNDAYRPSLGENGKHPFILGMCAEEAWPEIWHIIKPLIDQVFQGGEATWSEDQLIPIYRNGKIEDVYWTFSYSPVNNEQGVVGGVLVTCNETTEKIITLKKLAESKNELQFAIEAAELGTWDYNPTTNKFSGNARLKELYGLEINEEILLDIALNKIIDSDRQRVVDAITKALNYTSGGYYDIEYTIYNAILKNEIVIRAKGRAWFNEDKKAYRFNGTVQDVTQQAIAIKKIEESEQQVRTLFENAPFPIGMYTGKEMRIQLANQTIKDIWGKGNDVIGKRYADLLPELANQEVFEQLDQVYTTGNPFHAKNRYISLSVNDTQKPYYFNYSFTPLYNTAGEIYAVMNTAADVTDLNVAKQRIEESEHRFRNIANNAPVLIWMSGTDKQHYFFNKAWLEFTGRTIQQESGNGWIENVHADDVERCWNVYLSSFTKQETFYMEYRLKKHDGEFRWISDKGVPRFTSDGLFEGYIGACMDIHEQVIYQKKLKEDEERLNIVISASELGTWELNVKTDAVLYSQRFVEIFGYKNSVLTHIDTIKHFHPDDVLKRKKAFKDAYNNGVLHYESRIIWNDGSIHWIEVKGKVFYDDNNVPEHLIGTLRDITDEKNRQHELFESEQKFRLLADSMPQFIWTSTAEGIINYFNQSFYNYSGLTQEEIEKNGWLQIVHPDEQAENSVKWMNSINTGSDFLCEHRFCRNDGAFRWQLTRAVPQRDAAGNIQMWVGTSTDIQDQKMFTHKLEKQVFERTKQLEEKNKELEKMNLELQSFAYVSSHDLQEPLRKIQTFSTRILDKEQAHLSETGKDYFKRMQDAAKRMQQLIQDLLDYSRTSTVDRVFEKSNMNDIIEDVKKEFKESIADKNATVTIEGICEVNIIPFQFRQLMQNLLGNALKFSRPNVAPVIVIKSVIVPGSQVNVPLAYPKNNYCHLAFSDNGIGFDPQYKSKIFEVFQRLHGRNEYEGTGIGLAIVKKIVENHNGFIDVVGELGKGTTFNIYIPIL